MVGSVAFGAFQKGSVVFQIQIHSICFFWLMLQDEAQARIKTHRLLEETGWRFF